MRHRLTAAILALTLLAPVPAGATAVGRRGRLILVRTCAGCHAVGPRGTSPRPEAPAFRDLHERYPVDLLGEALAEGILTGHPDMPQFQFGPRQISDITAYLASIQTGGSRPSDDAQKPPSNRRRF